MENVYFIVIVITCKSPILSIAGVVKFKSIMNFGFPLFVYYGKLPPPTHTYILNNGNKIMSQILIL